MIIQESLHQQQPVLVHCFQTDLHQHEHIYSFCILFFFTIHLFFLPYEKKSYKNRGSKMRNREKRKKQFSQIFKSCKKKKGNDSLTLSITKKQRKKKQMIKKTLFFVYSSVVLTFSIPKMNPSLFPFTRSFNFAYFLPLPTPL